MKTKTIVELEVHRKLPSLRRRQAPLDDRSANRVAGSAKADHQIQSVEGASLGPSASVIPNRVDPSVLYDDSSSCPSHPFKER